MINDGIWSVEIHSRNSLYQFDSKPMAYEDAVEFQEVHKQNGFVTIMHMV